MAVIYCCGAVMYCCDAMNCCGAAVTYCCGARIGEPRNAVPFVITRGANAVGPARTGLPNKAVTCGPATTEAFGTLNGEP